MCAWSCIWQGGYMGKNFPKSSYPPDGGIDSHPFAGFGGMQLQGPRQSRGLRCRCRKAVIHTSLLSGCCYNRYNCCLTLSLRVHGSLPVPVFRDGKQRDVVDGAQALLHTQQLYGVVSHFRVCLQHPPKSRRHGDAERSTRILAAARRKIQAY